MYVLLSYVFYTYSELSIKTALQILQISPSRPEEEEYQILGMFSSEIVRENDYIFLLKSPFAISWEMSGWRPLDSPEGELCVVLTVSEL